MVQFNIDIVVEPRAATNNIKRVEQSVESLEKKTSSLATTLKRAFQVAAGAVVVRQVIGLLDSYTRLTNQLGTVVDGQEAVNDTLTTLTRVANTTRTEISAITQLYQRGSIAAVELGASQDELVSFTEKVGKALAIQGTAAGAARGALLQLSQALGQGIVRGEEFNSVLENAFPIAQAAARGIDRAGGSVSKLRNLVITGQISSEALFRGILEGSDEIEERFERTTATIGQAFTILRNNLTIFVGRVDRVVGASRTLSSGIIALSENFSTLATSVLVLGAAFASLKLGAFASNIATAVSNFVALRTAVASGTAVLLGSAEAERQRAAAIIAVTQAEIRAIQVEITRNSTLAATSAQTARLTVLTNQLAVAEGRLSVATAASVKNFRLLRTIGVGLGAFLTNPFVLMVAAIGTAVVAGKELFAVLEDIKQANADIAGAALTEFGRLGQLIQDRQREIDALVASGADPNRIRLIELSLEGLVQKQNALAIATRAAAAEAGKESEAFAALQRGFREEIELLTQTEAKQKETIRLRKAILKIEKETGKTVGEVTKANLKANIEFNERLRRLVELSRKLNGETQEYEQNVRDLNSAFAEGLITGQQYADILAQIKAELEDTGTGFGAGIRATFRELATEAENLAQVGSDIVNSIVDNTVNTLAEIASEGTFTFKAFARSIVADLGRIAARLLVVQAITAASGIFGGGGLGLGAGGATSLPGFSGFSARANGGSVQPNRAFAVGERGPELFVPPSAGTIIPNAAGAGAGGGVTVVNVTSMDDIPAAMLSGPGQEAILNVISQNPDRVKQAVAS